MIDLRSDTLTMPDEAMRAVMARAPVGDDVYGEDPSINELQQRVADLFGMEAALFVPSGTMGNQICLAAQARSGDEIIADADSHFLHYENGAASVIARAQVYTIKSRDGAMPLDEVEAAIRPSAYYYPRTCVIAVENTHNRHGGTVLPIEYLRSLRELSVSNGLAFHCDGARIWNACASSGLSPREYGALFTSMSVCMSKGAGAPVGSLVLGAKPMIDEARRWRKMLGGGMRQAGILAAGALYALDVIVPNIRDDHAKAKMFAETIAADPRITLDQWRVQSNIVMFEANAQDYRTKSTTEFVKMCEINGLRIAQIKPGVLRAVFHHQISMDDATTAAEIVVASLNNSKLIL
ncbi:MAG: aminotransferase class I/II-fold pyridoxal phosphate-dependent enzyme [Ignavibacteria bacterium]|nr:aminotransferase class I/II-fold pyridoxal phosphate-dependent enzyme [Ignavibacteria bacterium]